jgi:hypothetical protein
MGRDGGGAAHIIQSRDRGAAVSASWRQTAGWDATTTMVNVQRMIKLRRILLTINPIYIAYNYVHL